MSVLTSYLTVQNFAERAQIVKELQAECTRAEKGEKVDLRQTEEKLAGLVQQLHKDGEAINAGTKISSEIRGKYDLQKSDVTGLSARVTALSAKANSTPALVKPAVYTALTVGALTIALFIVHKILSSPPTPQPPPTSPIPQPSPTSPTSQPVCNPNYNPFIDFCQLQDQTSTPQSAPLGSAPAHPTLTPSANNNTPQPSSQSPMPSSPTGQTLMLPSAPLPAPSSPMVHAPMPSHPQPPPIPLSPQPVYNPNHNPFISDFDLLNPLQGLTSTPKSAPPPRAGGNRQTFIEALNNTNTTGLCSIYKVKSVEEQTQLSDAQEGYYSRGIKWLNDNLLTPSLTIATYQFFLNQLVSMIHPNHAVDIQRKPLIYNNINYLIKISKQVLDSNDLKIMNAFTMWVVTNYDLYNERCYKIVETVIVVVLNKMKKIEYLEQLHQLNQH